MAGAPSREIRKVDVLVVGGGPAGLAAAKTAAGGGLRVLLVDEAPRLGGQIWRQLPAAWSGGPVGSRVPVTAEPPADLDHLPGVEVVRGATVWHVSAPEGGPKHVLWAVDDQPGQAEADTLILAPGAYDRTFPFPGWDQPGVFALGGLQALLKGQGVIPEGPVVLAGTGPLLLLISAQLVDAGAQVAMVLELASMGEMAGALPGLLGAMPLLRAGMQYQAILRRHGVPIRHRSAVMEARGGEDGLTSVVVGRVDADGNPLPGDREEVEAKVLGVGYGLVPSTELARLAGCQLEYRAEAGGWVPRVDEWMETTVPGVYVAGDGAGITGAPAARLEGELAAYRVLERARGSLDGRVRSRVAAIRKELQGLYRFQGAMAQRFPMRPGLYNLLQDDVTVCRCEEVTYGKIRTALEAGVRGPNELKRATRCGMGMCQGRICGPTVDDLLFRATGQRGFLTARIPLKPITLGALARLRD